MRWFKMFAEARNDAKLRVLGDGEFRVWFNLLCFASEQKVRGTIRGRSLQLLAIEVAGGDLRLLVTTLEKLKQLSVTAVTGAMGDGDNVPYIEFCHFDERQELKTPEEREREAARVRRYREGHRAAKVEGCTGGTPPVRAREEAEGEENTTTTHTPRAHEVEIFSGEPPTNVSPGDVMPGDDPCDSGAAVSFEEPAPLSATHCEVLKVLGKTADWYGGTMARHERDTVFDLVFKLERDGRSIADVRGYTQRFADYLGYDPVYIDPPTPAQMLANFDRVLNFRKGKVRLHERHQPHPQSAAERRSANLREHLISIERDLQEAAALRASARSQYH